MSKGIIVTVGAILIIGLGVGAYWLGTQQKAPPAMPPTQTPALSPVPTAVPSPSPVPQTGTIEGSMSFPGEGVPDYIEVCAENQDTKEVFCTTERIQNPKYTYGIGYMLDVPPGTYLVYALDPNKNYKAYYSEFVTCGLSVDCSSHTPIPVEVKAGITTSEVDPQDWYK